MKKSITIQSLIIIFLCNAGFIAVYFFLMRHLYVGVDKWVEPFPALENLIQFMHKSKSFIFPVMFGAGAGFTIIAWLLISIFGKRLIDQSPKANAKGAASQKKDTSGAPTEAYTAQALQRVSLQILSILQRNGRLIDFLQEDLSQYDDTQIGSAARNIHSGCKETLAKHVKIEPVFSDEEGNEITVPYGFDSKSIQLTGNVKGNPPFKGVLRHRGWKVVKVQMPKLTTDEDKNNILAPAEVEIT